MCGLQVSVTEVAEVVVMERFSGFRCGVEELGDGVSGSSIACFLSSFESREGFDGVLSAFDFLIGRKDTLLGIAFDKVIDTDHIGFGVVVCQHREHRGNFHPRHQRQRGMGLSLLEVFHGGEFHGLVFGNLHGRTVAGPYHAYGTNQAENRSNLDAFASQSLFTFAEQVPGADADDEDRCKYESRRDGVEKFVHGHGREEHVPKVDHFVPSGFGVEPHSGRVLHPGVGHQNPEGREVGADGGEPGGGQVEFFGDLVPAEEHHGNKGRFHEEGHDAFDGERSAEDITDEVGVVAPVGSELEFEDKPRCDPDGEVDAEESHPEFGGSFPEFVTGTDIAGLHEGDDETESEGERDEQPVVDGCQGELGSRPVYDCSEVSGKQVHTVGYAV